MAHSRLKEWIDTDSNEVRVFLALLLMQGVNHKPKIQHYSRGQKCRTTLSNSDESTITLIHLLIKKDIGLIKKDIGMLR